MPNQFSPTLKNLKRCYICSDKHSSAPCRDASTDLYRSCRQGPVFPCAKGE